MRVVVRAANSTSRVVAIDAADVSFRDSLGCLDGEAFAREVHVVNQTLLVGDADLFALPLVSEDVSRRALIRFSEGRVLLFEHVRVLAL